MGPGAPIAPEGEGARARDGGLAQRSEGVRVRESSGSVRVKRVGRGIPLAQPREPERLQSA
jgi:hypothetical protein